MKPADRQKMCPNCDGRIPFDVGQCPYCFANVPAETAAPAQGSIFKNHSIQDSLYTPPYASAPRPEAEERRSSAKVAEKVMEIPETANSSASAKTFWPVLALAVGGNLFILGMLQFFFAEDGIVRLEINGSYWFLLVALSLPLVYLGLKSFNSPGES